MTAIRTLQLLIAGSAVVLAGCATPGRAPDVVTPVQTSEISGSTWSQVDRDIVVASQAATGEAKNYVRPTMERWRQLIYERTDSNFIPWFTSYWTQRWLTVKLAWYKVNSGEDTASAEKRLSVSLQEEYRDRVLSPASKVVNPDEVREHATKIYVESLAQRVQQLAQRYAILPDQLNQRLKEIPAIAAMPPWSTTTTSLYQLVRSDPIASRTAYAPLMAQIRQNAQSAGGEKMEDATMSPAARRIGDRLVADLATSGGAGAAAVAFGGVAGMVVSLGAAGYGAIAHENERPQMEAQLRQYLNTAAGDMWISLTEDPASGVLAGVYAIAEQIESSLAQLSTPKATIPVSAIP